MEIKAIKLTAFGLAGSTYPKSGSSILATSKSDPSVSFTDVILLIYFLRPILFVCNFVYITKWTKIYKFTYLWFEASQNDLAIAISICQKWNLKSLIIKLIRNMDGSCLLEYIFTEMHLQMTIFYTEKPGSITANENCFFILILLAEVFKFVQVCLKSSKIVNLIVFKEICFCPYDLNLQSIKAHWQNSSIWKWTYEKVFLYFWLTANSIIVNTQILKSLNFQRRYSLRHQFSI